MKAFERIILIGLVALLMVIIMFPDIKAQPLTGILNESMVSAQDTISTIQEAKLIELLSTSLRSLSDKARRDRRIGGFILLGLGIGSGIGGAATLAFGDGDDARIVGYSLLGGGLLLSGLSLLPFRISTESERIYGEFRRMPMDSPDQVREKFYYGDRRFEELAQKKRKGRFVGGISSILVGVISLILVDGSDEERFHAFIWPVSSGVVRLLIKSDEERRYDTYLRTKEDLMAHMGSSKSNFGFTLIPTGGMSATVHVRF